MDTQSLEAFVAVATIGSFSAAAEQLHLTQPAVSKRIAALEQRLDIRLFDRIGRQPLLTEAGRALLPRAQRILLDMADARRAIDRLHGTIAGPLKLGISHHLGLHRLPPLLARYVELYPEVKLDIAFLDSERAAERVLAGQLEIAVGTLSPHLPPTLQQHWVWQDELLIAVAREHPLAQHETVTVTELSGFSAIVPGLHTYTGKILAQLFQDAGHTLDVGMDAHYLETIKTMVAIGLGWSILPRTLIDDSVHTLMLCDPAGQPQHLSRELGYQVHRDRSLSNAATAFIKLLSLAREEHAGVPGLPADPHP